MKILLDENLDWRLGRELPGHAVSSVPLIGWAGIKNGELLRRASRQFDVLVTMDKGLYRQHILTGMKLILITLAAKSNRLTDTKPLMPALLAALEKAPPSGLIRIVP